MPPNNGAIGGVGLAYENEDAELLPSLIKKGYRTAPILFVNGKRVSPADAARARPNQTLLSFLRDVLRLTGTKLGCAEGGCGACTVMTSRYDVEAGKIVHSSVNACLMPVLAADGCNVTTVEGVGTVKGDRLHPVQKAMVDMHGSQCGFCTPGIIVAIYALLANNPRIDYVEEHLDGNLCRCTGYRPIWDAARSLCADSDPSGGDGDDSVVRGQCGNPCRACPERDACEMDCNVSDREREEGEGEEKKTESSSSGSDVRCSTSSSKAKEFRRALAGEGSMESTWIDRPNEMFPAELLPFEVPLESEAKPAAEASKPLVVVDRTVSGDSNGGGGTWFKPTTLEELLGLLRQFGGGIKIVVGNTEIGIETRFRHSVFPRLVFPSHSIASLYGISLGGTCLRIGACAPLSAVQRECEALCEDGASGGGSEPAIDLSVARVARPIRDMLRWFASTQIRNAACLGGNLVTASPISDMNPLLAAMGAELVVTSLSPGGGAVERRKVPVSDFFLRYRTVDLRPNELVEAIEVPLARKALEYSLPFKQARRREDDISIVTSGMRVVLSPGEGGDSYTIEEASFSFGGMAPTTVMAPDTAGHMIGRPFCRETFVAARRALMEELPLPDDVPGGMVQFRRALVASFVHKFFLSVARELENDIRTLGNDPGAFEGLKVPLPPPPSVDEEERSGADSFVRSKKPSTTGVQRYPTPRVARGLEGSGKMGRGDNAEGSPMALVAAVKKTPDSVGKPAPHASAPLHCSGEALYTDDVPLPPGTLQGCLVLATRCHARMEAVSKAAALSIPGVVAVYDHLDLTRMGGDNALGPIVHDETIFLPMGEKVGFVGQVLGICVGETLEAAESGARAVEVKYADEEGEPILSIEQAISAGSFYDFARHTIERGNVDDALAGKGSDIISVSGSFRCGGQEHFYLETNSTLVVPSESATNLTIFCSTQAPTKTQMCCASATNTPASKVVVRMKRMGGGFGGKETRSVFASCAAAVAAKLCDRPVRLTLSRDVDMSITGGRHSFLAKYRASVILNDEKAAQLHALDVKLFSNGGSAFDLSGPVMDRALLHVDGCYYWPIFRAVGVPCKTAQPPHTAFRGFGGPQGMAVCEHIMDHLAQACNVPGDILRRDNMYKIGVSTPFGMVVGEEYSGKWNVPKMWDRIYRDLNVAARRDLVKKFNKKNTWVKKGLSLIPTKFGIAFTAKFMNQGGALVHLYIDGTVLITHGGTEMGQGLHTKVCQIASQAFGISLDDVYINDTSTDKIANTMPTAASISTDMYGMATLDACKQILRRIEPVRKKLGSDATLKDVAKAAHMERIDLSAHGFFALDDSRCGYDWTKSMPPDYPPDGPANAWKGHPFNYFTQGVACTEVEIDVLTGNHRTISSDVLIDVGSSLNPVIDIGQVEGAFIQGMGWSTIEEVVISDKDHTWIRPKGKVFTSGPGTYKIPAFNDVPESFNISLLENVDNPFAVHSSKAIGEPPFFLGSSTFFAIREAVKAARSGTFGNSHFEMRMPATSERIRMMCADKIASDSIGFGAVVDDELEVSMFQPKGSH